MDNKQRYASPSTEGVQHDAFNLLVEGMFINRYGLLPNGAWRKGSQLQSEWSEAVKLVKRLCQTMKIEPACLAWYIKRFDVTRLDYEEFGLVRYKINKFFRRMSLEDFKNHFTTVYNAQIKEVSPYVEHTTTYKVKQAAPQRKTLQQILQEIENEAQGPGS